MPPGVAYLPQALPVRAVGRQLATAVEEQRKAVPALVQAPRAWQRQERRRRYLRRQCHVIMRRKLKVPKQPSVWLSVP